MTIVSLSLDQELLAEVDGLQESGGYGSRSEVVRDGLHLLLADQREQKLLSGECHAVLVVLHDESGERALSRLSHEFDAMISTRLHSHSGGKCLDVFMLNGPAKRVREMVRAFKKSRKAAYLKLLVP